MLHNLDSDSSKIIEAVRSTGVVITEAMRLYVDYIVSNMKAIGTWSLCSAVYGFVGGTAASHKWNWKDLRDVDAAFRLTFPNGATHNANGISTNGTNQYLETNFNVSTLTTRDNHLSIYLKSVNASTTHHIIGASNSSISTSQILLISRTGVSTFLSSSNSNYQAFNSNQTNLTGYLVGNSNSTNIFLYKNGTEITGGRVVGSSTVFPNLTLVISASKNTVSGVVQHSAITTPFSTIGAGLTDTQAQQQSQIVTNAQNILNRA